MENNDMIEFSSFTMTTLRSNQHGWLEKWMYSLIMKKKDGPHKN